MINADSVTKGEGSAVPSTQPPGAPRNLEVKRTSDGGADATWQPPPSDTAPYGIAGYYLT